jgi:outer membrane protein TolC
MKPFPLKLKKTTVALLLAYTTFAAGSAQALSLQEATALAIKNSPSIMTEGINVQLKGADRDIAYRFFNPKFETSFQVDSLGGFQYPEPIENLALASLSGSPNTAFLPDNSRKEDFKIALTRIWLNGLYTQVGVDLTQMDSDRNRLSASPAIDALRNGGADVSIDDYFPFTYGVVKFVTRVPLWGRGDLAEGIADYQSKLFQYQAAVSDMNHAVATILAQAIYAYWDNRAAVEKFELRQQSLERTERWAATINGVIDGMPNAARIRSENAALLGRIEGFIQEKRKNLNDAESELNQSRTQLANALGISVQNLNQAGNAADTLPSLAATGRSVDVPRWTELAQANRADIQARKLDDQAAAELLKWMSDYNKPELNAIGAIHQQMVDFGSKGPEGYLDALGNFSGNLGYTVGLQLTVKIGNSAGQGRVTQARLNRMKNQIALNNTLRQTSVNLQGLADRLSSTHASAEAAAASAAAYRRSAEAALADQRQTLETAFLQFETEREWINAEADAIQARTHLAKVIIEARHQTGTLIERTEDVGSINMQDLISLP